MMKVKVDRKETSVTGYPRLMISTDGAELVLFAEKGNGIVICVFDDSHFLMGHHSLTWDENCFEDFNGSVTLSND